jgi:hypothetical protein
MRLPKNVGSCKYGTGIDMDLYLFRRDSRVNYFLMLALPYSPFASNAWASLKDKRSYVGYDVDSEYVKLAERRIFNNFLK